MHGFPYVMRYDDEQDPKKPPPVSVFRKGDNTRESQEHGPRNVGPHGHKDDQRDHHRHVQSC